MTASVDALLAGLPERISDIPRRWAQRTPDAPALHEVGRSWTYRQLTAVMDEACLWLQTFGVRPGDRVMLVGENCIAQAALIFALAEMNAWSVSVNARLSEREVENIRIHCSARCVIYTVAVSEDACRHAEQMEAKRVVLPLLGEVAVSALNVESAVEPVEAASDQQVAALIYTTGTTGHPKGVMLTHRNLLFVAATAQQMRAVVTDDRMYGVLPISHVFGLASIMLGTLYSGASLDLAPRYTPQILIEAIAQRGITMLPGVPAMYARLLEFDRQGWTPQGSRLRYIYAGGAPLDPTLKRETETLFGLTLHNGYGMTESAPTISQTRIDAPARNDTSVGFAVPGVEVQLVSQKGEPVAKGEPGELWVRGPNIMKGYYREPELTADVMRPGGWLNTGDVVRMDSDGAMFIVGRTKELIIRSGFNVYPVEVEAALNSHPAVTQSAVVGRCVAEGNEEVIAFVEKDPAFSVTEEVLRGYLAERLSPYKVPSQIIIMPVLPAAATGKILKGELKKQAQQLYDNRTG